MTAYAYKGEAQFLAWGDGPQGPWIKLKLPDSDDLAPFRGMTQAKATQAGQILAVGVLEVTGEPSAETDAVIVEAAAKAVKGGELCKLAAILCSDEEFQAWIENDAPIGDRPTVTEGLDAEDRAAIIVRNICGIESRRELDHNALAAEIFHERIRKPYNEHLNRKRGRK